MRLFRRPGFGLGLSLLLLFLFLLEYLPAPTDSITITTVYAGKKKFRSYNLGLSFLPTLVKVKPNRFALSFRRSRYIRPPQFNIEGSLPLKVPTIIMERPDPYAKPEVININKDIKLGQDEDYGGGGDGYSGGGSYKAAASEEKPTSADGTANGDLSAAASDGQPVPTDDHRVPPEDQWAAPPPPQSGQMMPFYPPPPPPHFLPPPPPFSSEALPYPPPPPPPPFHLMPPSMIDPMFMARSQQHFESPEQSQQQQQHHRTRRSLNLNEPYHHHLGDHAQQQQHQLRVRRMPHEYSSPYPPMPMPPPPPPPLPFSYPRYSHYPYYPHPQPSSSSSYHHPQSLPPPFGATFLPPPPPPPPHPMWSPPPPSPMMYSSSFHQPRYQAAAAAAPVRIAAKQDTIAPEAQQFVVHEVVHEFHDATGSSSGAPAGVQLQQPNKFEIPVDYSLQKETVHGNQQQLMPMKINIGEHYNPNAVYMDESIIPSLEDAPLITPETMAAGEEGGFPLAEGPPTASAESSLGEESTYHGQYLQKPAYKPKDNNGGPDDFRVNFSFSGVHGGPLVPLGTGDNIEQYYKALKKFKGNNLPVGLPPEQLYRYYRAHTFTDGIRVYRLRPTKIVKSKLIKALLG